MAVQSSREAIKTAARALFAQRGVDAVSVRDILAASHQKNGASLHYYFGTKETLVAELVVDGARLIDERRNAMLDAIESAGGPNNLQEIFEVLVLPATRLNASGGEGDYLRFISTFSQQDRAAFEAIVGDGWNTGYQRCLTHIRRLSSAGGQDLERRLVFLGLSLRAVMTAREGALASHPDHPFWASDDTLSEIVSSLTRLVEA